MRFTFVISAFPGCGKSHCFNNQKKYSILDSDSSDFSWIKGEDGEVCGRNSDFPNNYIRHIRDNIGKVDVIFVSSHEVVRRALAESNIETITVFPYREMKDEWIGRFEKRGNTEEFIRFISDNWDRFVDDMEYDNKGFLKIRLGEDNKYIDEDMLDAIYDTSIEGNVCDLWRNY